MYIYFGRSSGPLSLIIHFSDRTGRCFHASTFKDNIFFLVVAAANSQKSHPNSEFPGRKIMALSSLVRVVNSDELALIHSYPTGSDRKRAPVGTLSPLRLSRKGVVVRSYVGKWGFMRDE